MTLDSINMTLDSDFLTIGPGSCSIDILGETTVDSYLAVHGNQLTDLDYNKTSYTSFSGGVISSGTINVVKQLGWCQVFGEIKLTGNISDWTQVLTAAQVPAPKHGVNIYPAATQWGTSFIRMPRIQVNGSGGLRLRYGAAATYNFDTTYPI